jgi:putative Mg2+ transporter-C (MgtC) family protein
MAIHWDLVIRLLMAAALGSLIGAERERLSWAAGLRTHMLVCVGSCLFMIVSAYGFEATLGPNVVLDPSRVAAQVVSGIGFLGAGSILLRGNLIKGLTTAASLWTVAAIGLAVGGGLYLEALDSTVVILIILVGVKPLESWYQRRWQTLEVRLTAAKGKLSIEKICDALGFDPFQISRYTSFPSSKTSDNVQIRIKRLSGPEAEQAFEKLARLPHVRKAEKI